MPRLVSGIQLGQRRAGISSLLLALDHTACQLCKQRQGFCYHKLLACRRTPVLASLLLSAFSHDQELAPAVLLPGGWWKSATVAGRQALLSSTRISTKGHAGLGWVLKTLHAAGNL